MAMDTTSTSTRTSPTEHSEGTIARNIEHQTAKLPSDTFLWVALGAMAGSAILQASGRQHVSLFVGQWVPTVLVLGLYNKLVKQLGSDRLDQQYAGGARLSAY